MKTILFSTDNYLGSSYNNWQDEYNELIAERCLPENYPFGEWLNEQASFDLECFKDKIKKLGECVITGRLGLWFGNRAITPTRFETVLEALGRCININYGFLKIELNNGHLEINISHHDGTNYFEIYLLNKKGQDAGENADLSKACYHAKIKL